MLTIAAISEAVELTGVVSLAASGHVSLCQCQGMSVYISVRTKNESEQEVTSLASGQYNDDLPFFGHSESIRSESTTDKRLVT
ncbi:hypothetical protein Bpfe_024646 [Biomphalaria pfeifferi]|uniref:Uncharacterized protein n=1 Tax=Biomphalaria pfeifferi TaxID=112525 RepID=A0AAD8EZ86_BIOPF|nr:hypothetical protein Bpfe_024646 [Biomphalaria pfeifferi]